MPLLFAYTVLYFVRFKISVHLYRIKDDLFSYKYKHMNYNNKTISFNIVFMLLNHINYKIDFFDKMQNQNNKHLFLVLKLSHVRV